MDSILILGIVAVMGGVMWSLYSYGKSLDIKAVIAKPEIGKVIKPVIKPDIDQVIRRIEANKEKDLSEKTEELREKWCAQKVVRRK